MTDVHHSLDNLLYSMTSLSLRVQATRNRLAAVKEMLDRASKTSENLQKLFDQYTIRMHRSEKLAVQLDIDVDTMIRAQAA